MSLSINPMARQLKRGGIVIVAIAGVFLSTLTFVQPSGAWFQDTKHTTTTISTAQLGLSLSNEDGNTGSFNLAFSDLVPGSEKTQTFTVQNIGSITGSVTLGSQTLVSGGVTHQASDLTYQVEGYGALNWANASTTLDLGTLSPGETRTYTMSAALAGTAGNDWQGAAIEDQLSISLTQIH